MGGMVLETNMTEILTRVEEQNKIEKEEVSFIEKKYLFFFQNQFDYVIFCYLIIFQRTWFVLSKL